MIDLSFVTAPKRYSTKSYQNQFYHNFRQNRARRRKKLAKALERQARKLRAKGISVDVDTLRTEYLTQHRVKSESDLEDDDVPIDVVGDDSDDNDDCSVSLTTMRDSIDDLPDVVSETTKNSIRPNPFSIESLLYNNT